MGTWGSGISSNDTYADVYDTFIELYNEGKSPAEITSQLVSANKEILDEPYDAPNFWYAVAHAQWECKDLQPPVLETIRDLVRSGKDLKIWEELGATQADLRKRSQVLEKFLAKLETEKQSARKRKKKKFFNSVFRKGDCLVYRMNNGNFGGAFVLTDEDQTVVGANYIAITTIDTSQKPVLQDFVDAEVYVRRRRVNYVDAKGKLREKIVDEPDISGYFALTFNAARIEIEVVGSLPIYNEFVVTLPSSYRWEGLISHPSNREIYERTNDKPQSKVFLSKWIKRRSGFLSRFKR